jgi:hypothetical protein
MIRYRDAYRLLAAETGLFGSDPLADVPRITPSPFAGMERPNMPEVLMKPGLDE